MSKLPIQVITFDLDDTLWHTAPVIRQAELMTYNWLHGHAPKMTAKYSQTAFEQIKLQVYQDHPELEHQISDVRIMALQKSLLQSGYSEAQSIDLAGQAFAVFLDARHQVELFDDTVMMLEALHPHYQLGVLTNGNADVSRLEIGEFFDFAFAAETLNSSKPAPAHFEAAIARSGVKPEQIVHIGDHPQHDVDAARAAGCQAIWFNRLEEVWPESSPEPIQVVCAADIPAAIELLQSSS
jgi:putative hydrolase of the HAD superfamily